MATIPPTPSAATAGGIATAAQFNALRDALALTLDPPHMIATAATSQAVPDSTFTPLAFDIKNEDNDAMFTAGGSSVTVKTPGRWLITGQGSLSANGTGLRAVGVYVNGVERFRAALPFVSGSLNATIGVSQQVRLALNDVVSLRYFQSSGTALNTAVVAGVGDVSTIAMHWLGR